MSSHMLGNGALSSRQGLDQVPASPGRENTHKWVWCQFSLTKGLAPAGGPCGSYRSVRVRGSSNAAKAVCLAGGPFRSLRTFQESGDV